MSIAFVFHFAALLLFGPHAAVLLSAVGALTQSTVNVTRRNTLHRVLFDMAALAVSARAGALAYTLLGGTIGHLVWPVDESRSSRRSSTTSSQTASRSRLSSRSRPGSGSRSCGGRTSCSAFRATSSAPAGPPSSSRKHLRAALWTMVPVVLHSWPTSRYRAYEGVCRAVSKTTTAIVRSSNR